MAEQIVGPVFAPALGLYAVGGGWTADWPIPQTPPRASGFFAFSDPAGFTSNATFAVGRTCQDRPPLWHAGRTAGDKRY